MWFGRRQIDSDHSGGHEFGMGWDWKSLSCDSDIGSASSSDIDGEPAARLVSSAGSHQASSARGAEKDDHIDLTATDETD